MSDLEKKAEASTRIVLTKGERDSINYTIHYLSKNTKTGSFRGGLRSAVVEILQSEVGVSTPVRMEFHNLLDDEQKDIAELFKAYGKIYNNLSCEFL